MIKLAQIIIGVFLLSQPLWAQEPTYKWGEPVTNDHTEREVDQLIKLGSEGFVLLRKHTNSTFTTSYWLESYSADLKYTGSNEVKFTLGVMGNFYNIEKISVANGVIYAFVTHWEKSAQKHTLSIKKLLLTGEMEDVKDLDVISAQKMGNRGTFNISFSDDGTKLIVLSELPFVKKAQEKIRLSCFDVASMNLLWSYDKELSWPSKRATNNEVVVDNKGQAYLFKKIWQKPLWRYTLYTYDGKSEWNTSKIEQGELQLVDYKIAFDKKNEFILYATVSKKLSHYKKQIHNSLYIHLASNLKDLSINWDAWDKEILTRVSGNKDYIGNLYIKDLLFKADGSLLVLMEQLRLEKKMIAGSSPIKYSYSWTYGSFLSVCINTTTGKLNWWQAFKKSQQINSNEEVDKHGSYVYHLKDDKLYVLWNNTALSVSSIPPANWKESDGTRYVKFKVFDSKTMHATFMHVIEPDGSLTYGNKKFGLPLFNLHKGTVFEMSLTTPFFFSLNDNLVIMAEMHNGGKRFRLGLAGF